MYTIFLYTTFLIQNLTSTDYNSFIVSCDDNGIWISTEKGWDRYDGEKVQTYFIDSEKLKGTWIQSGLYEDIEGHLWSSTYEYINQFDKENDEFSSFQLVLKGDTLKTGYHVFHIDNNRNSILLTSANHIVELNIADRDVFEIIDTHTVSKRFLYTTINDRPLIVGCPYVGHTGIEVYSNNVSSWTKSRLLDSIIWEGDNLRPVISQALHAGDYIFLISTEGIITIDAFDLSVCDIDRLVDDKVIYNHAARIDDLLYITTIGSGVLVFDMQTFEFIEQWTVDNSQNPIASNSPVEIFSRDDVLYLCHRGIGVERIRITKGTQKISDPDYYNYDSFNELMAIIEEDKVVIHHSNISRNEFPLLNDFDPAQIKQIKLVSDHELIIMTLDRLYLFNTISGNFQLLKKLTNDQFYYLDNIFGHFLPITTNQQVYNLNTTTFNLELIADQSIKGDVVHFVWTSDSTYLYYTGGKALIHNLGNVIVEREDVSYINSLTYQPKENEIYICSKSEFNILDAESLDIVLSSASWMIPENTEYYSSIQSESNVLFMNTSYGVYALDTFGQLIRNVLSENQQFDFLNEKIEINWNNELLVPTTGGIFTLNTNVSQWERTNPRVELKEIYINRILQNRDDIKNELLSLPVDKNSLSFKLNVIEFGNNNRDYIRYRLLGLSNLWKSHSEDSPINFERLPSGKYTLEVVGVGSDNSASSVLVIPIVIELPFLQTWLFRLVATMSIIGLISLVYVIMLRKRIRNQRVLMDKQKALFEQKEIMANDLHDEMGSGLSKIKHLSEALGNETDELHDSKIELIETLSTNLLLSMRELLWSLNHENDPSKILLARIRLITNQLLDKSGLDFKINLSTVDDSIEISGQTRRNLLLIIKELLTNVLKHARATHVKLDVSIDNNRLDLYVEDDGIGMEAPYGTLDNRGLKSIMKRAELLNGELKIESINRGVCIYLSIPIA